MAKNKTFQLQYGQNWFLYCSIRIFEGQFWKLIIGGPNTEGSIDQYRSCCSLAVLLHSYPIITAVYVRISYCGYYRNLLNKSNVHRKRNPSLTSTFIDVSTRFTVRIIKLGTITPRDKTSLRLQRRPFTWLINRSQVSYCYKWIGCVWNTVFFGCDVIIEVEMENCAENWVPVCKLGPTVRSERLRQRFLECFNAEPDFYVRVPGR